MSWELVVVPELRFNYKSPDYMVRRIEGNAKGERSNDLNGGVRMNAKLFIGEKIKEMRKRVAEAYMQENADYDNVLKLSIKLDRLILLELKARKSSRKAG